MSVPTRILLLIVVMAAGACGAQEASMDPHEAAIAWVSALPDNCVYEDGYTCVGEADSETDYIDEVDASGMLSGRMLEAWNVAWSDFRQLEDFSAEQKKLKHYRVGFSRDGGHIIVVLRPLMLPWMEEGRPAGISRGTIGPGVKYWINNDTLEIANRLYQR